jgi:hypothetical protein
LTAAVVDRAENEMISHGRRLARRRNDANAFFMLRLLIEYFTLSGTL